MAMFINGWCDTLQILQSLKERQAKPTSRLGSSFWNIALCPKQYWRPSWNWNLQKNDHTVEVDEVRLNKVRPAYWEKKLLAVCVAFEDICEQIAKAAKWNWVRARATLQAACTGLPKSSGRRPYLAASVVLIVGLAWFQKHQARYYLHASTRYTLICKLISF